MKITIKKESNGTTSKQSLVVVKFDEEIASSRFDGEVLTIKTDKIEEMGLYNFRLLLRSVIRTAQGHKIEKLALGFTELYTMAKLAHVQTDTAKVCGGELTEDELAEMLGYELELANYNFNDYKKKPKDGFAEVKEIFLSGLATELSNPLTKFIKTGQNIAKITNNARSVANTPAQDMTPKKLASIAKAEVKKLSTPSTKLRVKVLGKKQIEAQKMGAFLAVSRASAHDPQLIIVEYNGGKKGDAPLAIVGKAVTYDTGGLGIKPGEGMVDMHLDMSGGAMAMHSVFAMAKLGIKKNMVAIVPATENAIGKDAYRNGDVLKSMSGKTIEVRHTDAEGRLILADALTYAQKHYKPKAIIDIATLTGAAVMAIGQHASLIMTNSCQSTLPSIARKAGAETGNRVWQMPLWDVYKSYVKSKVADISNLGSSKWGGAITAGIFLAAFIDKGQDWMHIDIAPRMESVEGDNLAHGATGEPVYLLTKLAQRV